MNGTMGRRVDDTEDLAAFLEPGDYGVMTDDGNWYAKPPGTDLVANLANHEVVEHEDGTITVSPSILCYNHTGRWHGYLERGIWREVS